MKRIVALIIFLLFSFVCNTFASAGPHQNGKIFFNTKQGSQTFEDLMGKLKTPNVDLPALILYVQQIERLQDKAEACVQQSSGQLKELNALQKATQLDDSLKLKRADHQYLQDKKLFYSQQLSECRFFVYQLQQALMNYKAVIQRLSARKILQQSTPFWMIDAKAIPASFKNIEAKKIYIVQCLSYPLCRY